jgi:hypothetical protein
MDTFTLFFVRKNLVTWNHYAQPHCYKLKRIVYADLSQITKAWSTDSIMLEKHLRVELQFLSLIKSEMLTLPHICSLKVLGKSQFRYLYYHPLNEHSRVKNFNSYHFSGNFSPFPTLIKQVIFLSCHWTSTSCKAKYQIQWKAILGSSITGETYSCFGILSCFVLWGSNRQTSQGLFWSCAKFFSRLTFHEDPVTYISSSYSHIGHQFFLYTYSYSAFFLWYLLFSVITVSNEIVKKHTYWSFMVTTTTDIRHLQRQRVQCMTMTAV